MARRSYRSRRGYKSIVRTDAQYIYIYVCLDDCKYILVIGDKEDYSCCPDCTSGFKALEGARFLNAFCVYAFFCIFRFSLSVCPTLCLRTLQ